MPCISTAELANSLIDLVRSHLDGCARHSWCVAQYSIRVDPI